MAINLRPVLSCSSRSRGYCKSLSLVFVRGRRFGARLGLGQSIDHPPEVPYGISTRTPYLFESERKRRYLPKCEVYNGLPEGIQERNRSLVDSILYRNFDLQHGILSTLKEARLFDWHKEDLPPRYRYVTGQFQNFLRLVWSCLPPEHFEHSEVNAEVLTRFLWYRGQDRFGVTGRPPYLVTSQHPLPVFAPPEMVEATKDVQFQDGGPVSITVDLPQDTNHLKAKEFIALGLDPMTNFSYPHTLLYPITLQQFKHEIHFKATMFQFAYLAAHAVLRQGVKFGETLKNPLTMQSICFGGRVVYFSCFQLNTLDLEGDSGIKNIVWQKNMKLYEDVNLHHSQSKVTDYNRECFKTMLEFMINYDRQALAGGDREVYAAPRADQSSAVTDDVDEKEEVGKTAQA